jgi:hypothetical protein
MRKLSAGAGCRSQLCGGAWRNVDERLEHMHQITGVATQIFLTAEISRLHLNFFCITSIFE